MFHKMLKLDERKLQSIAILHNQMLQLTHVMHSVFTRQLLTGFDFKEQRKIMVGSVQLVANRIYQSHPRTIEQQIQTGEFNPEQFKKNNLKEFGPDDLFIQGIPMKVSSPSQPSNFMAFSSPRQSQGKFYNNKFIKPVLPEIDANFANDTLSILSNSKKNIKV